MRINRDHFTHIRFPGRLRNFIRIFGEPASSTNVRFIQIQLAIGLTKLLKTWQFQGFYPAMLLWWQWIVVVVGGGNCGCGISLIWEMPCTQWRHPKTKSIMAVFHHDHHLFKCSQSKEIWGKINDLSKVEISQVFQNKHTYWKRPTHFWEYVTNPEIQKNPGQFLIKY